MVSTTPLKKAAGLICISAFLLAPVVFSWVIYGLRFEDFSMGPQVMLNARTWLPDSVWQSLRALKQGASLLLAPLFDPVLYLVLIGIFVLERLIPARLDQKVLSTELGQDAFWFVMHSFLTVIVVVACVGWLSLVYRDYLGLFTIKLAQPWPSWLRIGLALLMADFLDWLHHLVRHKVWVFWCFHTVHHSQRRMNLFTDDRQHIADPIIANVVVFIPMFMLEIDAPMAVYLILALKWYPKLYHANVKTNFGLFKYVMVTPQSHRIHHSIDPRHRDKNFGVVFSIWDRMFGTLYPHYDEYPETGITDHRFPLEQDIRGMNLIWNYLRQFAYPFMMVYRQLRDTALTSARSHSHL